jgi:hypothetical protein
MCSREEYSSSVKLRVRSSILSKQQDASKQMGEAGESGHDM